MTTDFPTPEPVKESFGQKMKRLKEEKKVKALDASIPFEVKQRKELGSILKGEKSGKDPLDVLDRRPNELNGFERAMTGWGAGTIWFIRTVGPIIIILGILAYVWETYKVWIRSNFMNIFNGIAYLGLFVGIGNILYDILQKGGQLKPSVRVLSMPAEDILLFKKDKRDEEKVEDKKV